MIDKDLQARAEKNDIDALYQLAVAYHDGEDGEENQSKAFSLSSKILTQQPDHAKALNVLASCYANGVGVATDGNKAIELYRKSAELGYTCAQYNLAKKLQKAQDAGCLVWYQKAMEQGDADAPYELALIYLEGKLVATDIAKWLEYLNRGDEMGNMTATTDLAVAYINGKNQPCNYEKGAALLCKAAQNGNGVAAETLSIIYEQGTNIEVDIEKSIDWAIKAAKLGKSKQIFSYAVKYFHGQEPLHENKEKAVEFFVLAANAGSIIAMENLGICYSNGYGVAVDLARAITWNEKAAKEGSTVALDCLEGLYEKTDSDSAKTRYFDIVKLIADDGYYDAMSRLFFLYRDQGDIDVALKYLQDAVDGKNAIACHTMGLLYIAGKHSVAQNTDKAIELWTIAANKGLRSSAENLATLYQKGGLISKNTDKAVEWYEKAISLGSDEFLMRLALAYDEDGWLDTDFTKAASYYQQAHEKGIIEATEWLAGFYQSGKGVPLDEKKAVELYQIAAQKGSARALCSLGIAYFEGQGVETNNSLAIEYLEKSIAAGNESAANILAIIYKHADKLKIDATKAFAFLLARAEEGNAEAQYQVAEAYQEGNGVEEDHDAWEMWTMKAADNGYTKAQRTVGLFAHMVHGDTEKAVKYLEMASDAGDIISMARLGDIYYHGTHSMDANPTKAIPLYECAAVEGYSDAQSSLAIAYMNGVGVQQDDRKALYWNEKAAAQGDKIAQFRSGVAYQNGKGVIADPQKALAYYLAAAEQGMVDAQYLVAEMYNDEDGITPDYKKAEEYYKKVVESNDTEAAKFAAYNLAMLYSEKFNNEFKAFPMWMRVAETGDVNAQFNVGLYYHEGWGTAKDNDQAILWWRRAAAQGHESAQRNIDIVRRRQQQETSSQHTPPSSSSSQSSGGCYVATCVYGSYDCPEVWTLRRFRDDILAPTWGGKLFIKVYYAVSPTIVKWFGGCKWFQTICKGKLDKLVAQLQSKGVEDTPYQD